MPSSWHYNTYVHQVVGNVYNSLLEYITTVLYSRFKTKLMGTYGPTLKTLRQLNANTRLPAICMDVTLPIETDERARQLWRTQFWPGLSKYLYKPIYRDEKVVITPGFVRYSLNMICYLWFDSIYELIDVELRFIQAFSDVNRWKRIYDIIVYCPLPNSVYYYSEDQHTLTWSNRVVPRLLDTINKEVPMLPLYMTPLVKMNSISDISTKFKDSGDDISTYRKQVEFTIECEIPTFYIITSNYRIRELHFSLNLDETLLGRLFNLVPYGSDIDPENNIYVTSTTIADVCGVPSDVEIVKWVTWIVPPDFKSPYTVDLTTLCSDSFDALLILNVKERVSFEYIDQKTISITDDSISPGVLLNFTFFNFTT